MRKRWGILAALLLVGVLGVGAVSRVMAEETPPSNEWLQQMWQYCHGTNGSGGMMGAYGGMMGGYGMLGAGATTEVAKLLGISAQDLLTERQSGKSIFQIAQAKGFSEQQVLDAALAPYKDELALRVKYRSITEDQVAQLVKLQEDRLRLAFSATNTAPTSGTPGAGFGPRGMMGSYGGGMMGGYGGMMGGGRGMGGWW